jgi:hypothetical protein
MREKLLYAAWAILAAVVVYAFVIIGSPQENRKLLADRAVLDELKDLHCILSKYDERDGKLPATLEAAIKNSESVRTRSSCNHNYCYARTIKDGKTEQNYTYTPAQKGYRVCAQMESSWEKLQQNVRNYGSGEYLWAKDYAPGQACFDRTFDTCEKKEKDNP